MFIYQILKIILLSLRDKKGKGMKNGSKKREIGNGVPCVVRIHEGAKKRRRCCGKMRKGIVEVEKGNKKTIGGEKKRK